MNEPTQKLSAAIELLERSLSMYFEGNSYFAALHLAGGAEEVLGAYVERQGHESSFKSLQAGAVKISQILPDGTGSSPKDIGDIMNYAKNRTKHINKEGDDDVHFDPKVEALDLLNRAVSNYYMLMRYYNLPETELIGRFNTELRA